MFLLLALVATVGLLAAVTTPGASGADLSDEECDVSTGDSIQAAVDNASPHARIIVCEATYEENVTIDKDGIQLLGKGTPILDGTVLGATHGITIAEDVRDVRIEDFEIRNFDAELEDDPSSGIASQGHTYNVTLRGNDIHDNAWAGVLAADGDDVRWRLEDNHFDHHGFAHVFVQDLLGLTVEDNFLASSDQGLILADTSVATLENNTLHGGGNGAIAITPGLGDAGPSTRLTLTNNTIDGKWDHGLWLLDPTNVTLEHNNASLDGTALTLGADPAGVDVDPSNTFSTSSTDLSFALALDTFETGQPEPPSSNTTLGTVTCDLDVACSPNVIEDLFDYALQTALNPLASGQDASDAENLTACEGKNASCLRDAFFRDDRTPQNWTVHLSSKEDARMEFLDSGLRRPGEAEGLRTYTDDLEGNWTTLVLCRLYVNETVYPCQAAPQQFAFGLNLDRTGNETPRHLSEWRLLQPGDGVHDRLERVHGPDATLFKRTTPAHHEDSTPPASLPLADTPDPELGPNREEAPGTLYLACQIHLGGDAQPAGCPEPTLAREALDPGLAYCPASRTAHEADLHHRLGPEALTLWRWSKHCQPFDHPQRTTWNNFLTEDERSHLAHEHEEYYNASTDEQRQENRTDARRVFEHAMARQLAVRLDGHGLPVYPNETLLANATPTAVNLTVPWTVSGGPAVEHDGKIYVFATDSRRGFPGSFDQGGDVLVFDPGNESYRLLQDRLPWPISDTSAVSDGEHIYLFGGRFDCGWFTTNCPVKKRAILKFDPVTEEVTQLHTTLPEKAVNTAAVWDPRDRPYAHCPGGCAYVYGVSNNVVQFNPALGLVEELEAWSPSKPIDAIWVEDAPYVFWEKERWWSENCFCLARSNVPLSTETVASFASGPGARLAESGDQIYVLGGNEWTESQWGSWWKPTDMVRAYNRTTDETYQPNVTLAFAAEYPATASLEQGSVFLLGGGSNGEENVQRFEPAVTNATTTHTLADTSTNFSAVDLQAEPFKRPNVDLAEVEVLDNGTWRGLQRDALTAFTPVRLTANVTYEATNRSSIRDNVEIVLDDQDTRFTNTTAAEYAGQTYAGVTAVDPDNRNFTRAYNGTLPWEKRVHTLPLINASEPGEASEDAGLYHAGTVLRQNATRLTACVRELHTATANGSTTNLDPATHEGGERLAYEDQKTCRPFSLDPTELSFQPPVSLSLVVKEGDTLDAEMSIIDDPTQHITEEGDILTNRTLSHARNTFNPNPYQQAVEIASGRIIVTIPEQAPLEQARLVAGLIDGLDEQLSIFAIAIDGLPNPPILSDAVSTAVRNNSATVITGAGSLPPNVTKWPLEDKLMTIRGLAAHPLVLTVGAGNNETGMDPGSRRGPTPELMGPKPDLVAPSPSGTTTASVWHVLPFVEALSTHGLREANLVRTALAGYSLPISTQNEIPATFYSQGFGTVDLGAFLDLPKSKDLLDAYRDRQGLNWTDTNETLARTLDTNVSAIENASARELVAVTENPAPLVRSAVSGTLVNLTLNSPTLPHTSVADYGLVNYNRSAKAYVGMVDLDSMVNRTLETVRLGLMRAGYTDTEVDQRMDNLTGLFTSVVDARQAVTINVTHYYFPELLSGDYLYTLADTMVNQTEQDLRKLPEGASHQGIENFRDRLSEWKLEPHHLVQEESGYADMGSFVTSECRLYPVADTLSTIESASSLIMKDARRLAATPAGDEARRIVADIPTSPHLLLSRDNTAFVVGQGQQLACGEDQRRSLKFLQERALEMRRLQSSPMGAWNQTEMVTGGWNLTPLGHQIANTTDRLDPKAETLADNTTLVMDVTIEALARSIDLLEQKIDLLAVPQVQANSPEADPDEVFNPRTLPNRTRESPLGAYVGIARLTNHGLNATNPLTGEEIEDRDLTIPLPSLLWNNPTLRWTEAYRDGSPIENASVGLVPNGDGGLASADVTDVRSIVKVNGTNVSVAPNASILWAEEHQMAQNVSQTLDALRHNASFTEQLGPFNETLRATLDRTEADLDDWINKTRCAESAPGCRTLDESLDDLLGHTLSTLLESLYSHSTRFQEVTNASGEIEFPYLWPGEYGLGTPYPYPLAADMNRPYDYAAPGQGWFDGNVQTPSVVLHRQAHRTLQNLPVHPTGQQPGPSSPQSNATVPDSVDAETSRPMFLPYIEVHGNQTPRFHRFAYQLDGVDLPGFACLDAAWFQRATNVSVTYPGCGQVPLNETVANRLETLRGLARCTLGLPHASLGPSVAQACSRLHQTAEDIQKRCSKNGTGEAFRCKQADELNVTLEALDTLQRRVGTLLQTGERVLVPFARSPKRVLETRPEEIGFTVENQTARSQRLSPDDGNVTPEVRDVVSNVSTYLEDPVAVNPPNTSAANLTITTPPRVSEYTHTTAQGINHHVTDRVSGLDWVHLGTDRVAIRNLTTHTTTDPEDDDQVLDDEDVERFLREVEDLAVGNSSETSLENYRQAASVVSGINESFLAGLAQSRDTTAAYFAEGWRPNGTVTLAGLDLTRNETGTEQQVPAHEACQTKARLLAVPTAYMGCETVTTEAGPEVQGLRGVDKASAANVILEGVRETPDAFGEPPDETRVREILEKSVALSASNLNHTVRRSEETFLVDKKADEVTPAAGLMLYSTPLPLNEYVQYRIDAQVTLENTAALLVTTANPAITQGVIGAVDEVGDLANKNTTALDTALSLVDTLEGVAKNVSSEDRDPLVRADILGLPVKAEQKTNLPAFAQLGDEEANVACGEVAKAPDAKVELCEHGLIQARPDGHYNYTVTHEMETDEAAGVWGPSELHTLLVYLPSISQSRELTRQTLAVHNFTLELSPFLGLRTDDELPAQGGQANLSVTAPIRYRANVEDYKQLWAVPDAPLDSPGTGLDVSFRIEGTAANVTLDETADEAQLREGLTAPFGSFCPDSHTPGVPTRTFATKARGIVDDPWLPGAYFGDTQDCRRNTIHGLEPYHVPHHDPRPGVMTKPEKRILDALQYQFNIQPLERFSHRQNAFPPDGEALNPLNTPLGLVGQSARTLPPPSDTIDGQAADAIARVQGELDSWASQVPRSADLVEDGLGIDLGSSMPFLSQSWIAKRESEGYSLPAPVSNWAVLDEQHAFALLNQTGNLWEPETPLVREDTTQASASDRNLGDLDHTVSAHAIPERNRTGAHAAVLAHGTFAELSQTEDAEWNTGDANLDLEAGARWLAGNGITGAGVAMELYLEEDPDVRDKNPALFLEGHGFRSTNKIYLDLYRLGGPLTAGSDCANVPLYEYVQSVFRCTGIQAVETLVIVDGAVYDCFDPARQFIAHLQDQALEAEDRRLAGEPMFQIGREAQRALSTLTEQRPTAPPENPAGLLPQPLAQETAWHASQASSTASHAASLLFCLQPVVGVYAELDWSDFADQLSTVAQDILTNGTRNATLAEVQNTTTFLEPQLEDGPLPRRVEGKVLVSPQTRARGATNTTGNTPLEIAIDEWKTQLSEGTLTTTETATGGTQTRTILERYNATEVNETFTDSLTLGLDHGETWTVNLSVEDVYGWNGSDVVTFTVDNATPTVNPASTIPSVTATTSLNVSWSIEDPTSGLHAVDGTVRTSAATWPLNVSLTETQVNATDPVTVNATVNLSNLTTGDSVNVAFTVEDRAGNTNTTDHLVDVDRVAPSLEGRFTTKEHREGLITVSHLNTTWTIEDTGPANLTQAKVNLFNTTLGANQTLAHRNTSADLDPFSGEHHDKPYPNTTYQLYMEAEDAAGNTNTTLNDTVEVQIAPSLGVQIPVGGKGLFHDVLPHRFTDVHLPGYGGLTVEEVRVNVTEEETNGPPAFSDGDTDVATELLRLPWDAAADGANWSTHQVNLTAHHGRAVLTGSWNVTREDDRLTAQYNSDTDLAEGVMYGQVNASQPVDTFEARFLSCDDSGNVTFQAQGFGQDVNLHTQGSWNLQWKNDTRNTSGLNELADVTWTGLTDSRMFDVSVKLNDSSYADYELSYSTSCRQDDDNDSSTDDPFQEDFLAPEPE